MIIYNYIIYDYITPWKLSSLSVEMLSLRKLPPAINNSFPMAISVWIEKIQISLHTDGQWYW